MPRRSKVEGRKEEGEEECQVRQLYNDVMNAVLTADFVHSTFDGEMGGTVEETCGVERSSSGVLAGELFSIRVNN